MVQFSPRSPAFPGITRASGVFDVLGLELPQIRTLITFKERKDHNQLLARHKLKNAIFLSGSPFPSWPPAA